MYSTITKFYKMVRSSTMCTSVHTSIHRIMGVSMMSMCMPWMMCMHMWSMFLSKHRFHSLMIHGTLAQSGAQTIYTLLQHASIIVNIWRRCEACKILITRSHYEIDHCLASILGASKPFRKLQCTLFDNCLVVTRWENQEIVARELNWSKKILYKELGNN